MRLGERLRASLSGALERAPRRVRSVRSRRSTLARPDSRLSDDVLFLCEGDDELNSLTASGSSNSSLAEVSAASDGARVRAVAGSCPLPGPRDSRDAGGRSGESRSEAFGLEEDTDSLLAPPVLPATVGGRQCHRFLGG